jgi:hypothetical protein
MQQPPQPCRFWCCDCRYSWARWWPSGFIFGVLRLKPTTTIVMCWTTESSVFWKFLYMAYNACVTYFWYNHSFVIVVYVVSLKQIDIGNWLFCMDYRLVIDVLSIMTDWYHNIFRCVRCYSEYQVQVMGRVYYVGWATSSRAIVRIHFTLYACFQNKIK